MGTFLRIEHKVVHSTKDDDDKDIVEWMQKLHGIKVETREDIFVTRHVTYLSLDKTSLLEQLNLTPIDLSFSYSPDHAIGLVWDNVISVEVVGDDPSGCAKKIVADILVFWKARKSELFSLPTEGDIAAQALQRERDKPKFSL